MLTLFVIGLLSGIVTGISPCVLPVLPVVLAASTVRDPVRVPVGAGGVPGPEVPPTAEAVRRARRHPYLVVAGIVTSFTIATLLGSALLAALGLPQDVLRWAGIVALVLAGAALLIPQVGHAMQRLFARVPQRGAKLGGSSFVFGVTFGLVFVPCAGPVLAAITVLSATQGVHTGLLVLTVSFGLGVAIPLLAFAILGQRASEQITAFRTRASLVRKVSGAILILTALALSLNVTESVQRLVPSYAAALQTQIESNDSARQALDSLRAGNEGSAAPESFDECADDPTVLRNCGEAPDFKGIEAWLNTPNGKALDLDSLRGHVVLLDFWTYSCINCQRTLPYLERWDSAYRDKGLVTIGVHTPEFAFERVTGNITDNAARLGVQYPIAVDNGYETWNAYNQRFWPAHYLIDRDGVVRQVHYGEGAYEETEALIRSLLSVEGPAATAEISEAHAEQQTPETYLGTNRLARLVSGPVVENQPAPYEIPATQPQDSIALGGTWTLMPQYAEASEGSNLRLRYTAKNVNLVLGGQGRVTVSVAGKPSRIVDVSGTPRLYRLIDTTDSESGVLNLSFSTGLQAYAFSFG